MQRVWRVDYNSNINPAFSDHSATQMIKPAESLLTRYFHFPFVVSRFWAMELWGHADPRLVWRPAPGDSKCLGWRRFLGGITDLLTARAFWKNKIREELAPTDSIRAFQNPSRPTNSSAVRRAQRFGSDSSRKACGGEIQRLILPATSENLKTKSFLLITFLPPFLITLFFSARRHTEKKTWCPFSSQSLNTDFLKKTTFLWGLDIHFSRSESFPERVQTRVLRVWVERQIQSLICISSATMVLSYALSCDRAQWPMQRTGGLF